MEHNERHIINEVLDGKTNSFAYFVEQYSQQIYSLIIGMVENKEDAEELTQDTFLKAFRSLASFNTNSKFSTWLYRIAYNNTVSHLRRRTKEQLPMDERLFDNIRDEDVDKALDDDNNPQIEKLYRAISKLQADEKVLITLFYMEEKPISETANILGISESNAKVKLHRTRKKIYLLMKDDEFEKE